MAKLDFLSGDVTRYTMILCREGSSRAVKEKFPHLELVPYRWLLSIDDGVWELLADRRNCDFEYRRFDVHGTLEEGLFQCVWGSSVLAVLREVMHFMVLYPEWLIFGTEMVDMLGPYLGIDHDLVKYPCIWLAPGANKGYIIGKAQNYRYYYIAEKIEDKDAVRQAVDFGYELIHTGCSITRYGRTNRLAVESIVILPTNREIREKLLKIFGMPMLENKWLVGNTMFSAD